MHIIRMGNTKQPLGYVISFTPPNTKHPRSAITTEVRGWKKSETALGFPRALMEMGTEAIDHYVCGFGPKRVHRL